MPMGLLGAGVWDTWAHQPFNPSQQLPGRPDYLPISLSPSGFHPFPGSPFSSPAQISSLGSSANGAGNLDPLPPSRALLIGSGAFSSGKAVIRGWIPTDREQPPPTPTPPVPSNFRSLLSHSPILPPSPSPPFSGSALSICLAPWDPFPSLRMASSLLEVTAPFPSQDTSHNLNGPTPSPPALTSQLTQTVAVVLVTFKGPSDEERGVGLEEGEKQAGERTGVGEREESRTRGQRAV